MLNYLFCYLLVVWLTLFVRLVVKLHDSVVVCVVDSLAFIESLDVGLNGRLCECLLTRLLGCLVDRLLA